MTVPYAFSAATSAIPLSQLDDNFNTTITLGNTAIQLGNTVTTLNNMTLANVTISSGNVTLTNVTVTTANATTVNTTTLIATTANVTTVNATNINVATTSILNYGTVNGVAYLNASKALTTGSVLTFDGTTLTANTLNTTGTANFASNVYLTTNATYYHSRTSGGTYIRMLGINSANTAYIGPIDSGPGDAIINAASSSTNIQFYASGSEQMRLNSTGLGIGTSSPGQKLDVSGADGVRARVVASSAGTSGLILSSSGATAYSIKAGNGDSSLRIDQDGNDRITLASGGNLGIGTSTTTNGKLSVQAGTSTTGNSAFFTTADGVWNTYLQIQHSTAGIKLFNGNSNSLTGDNLIFGNASTAETMRIDGSGNLLVGKTSVGTAVGIQLVPDGSSRNVMADATNSSSTLEAYSTGAAAFRFYVGMGGTVYATNTTISAISDQRLKENVRDLDDGLSAIMALKPRKFDWKAGKGKDIKDDRGFIAQEFEQVFPEMIDNWKDPAPEGEEPYKSVRADLIPVLVKALQELKAEFDTYKATHP